MKTRFLKKIFVGVGFRKCMERRRGAMMHGHGKINVYTKTCSPKGF